LGGISYRRRIPSVGPPLSKMVPEKEEGGKMKFGVLIAG
jgi:hypothetical protein